jgi:hypothetical protein
MSDNRISPELLSAAAGGARVYETPRAPFTARLIARLRAGKFDRLIAVGVRGAEGTPLAAHEERLTSVGEREAIARSLRQAVSDARGGGVLISSRVPLHIPNVTAAEDMIDAVTLRLHSPRPVSARGMARLRQVLADGTGPFYRYGRGDLNGRLGAALAEL